MDAFIAAVGSGAVLVVGAAVLILWSLYTIFSYFFGGSDPLVHNTLARIEAAQNPANLIHAKHEFENRKRRGCLFVTIVALFLLFAFFTEDAMRLSEALWALAVDFVETIQEAARSIYGRLSAS